MDSSQTISDSVGPSVGATRRSTRTVHPFQGAIGLSLCALVVGAWLSLHVVGVFVLPVTWETAPIVPLVMLTQCWLSVGVFIIAHDAMHGSLAPYRPRLNAVIGGLILFLYAGFSWRKVLRAHMAHHRAPGTAEDPDFFVDDPEAFWPWYRTFFTRYFGFGSVLFVCTVVAIYALALGASVVNIVLFYGAPALGSSLQLFYFGTYLPHRHEETAFADDHKARTSDYHWLVSLLTCFHFGYHHEHHLSPGVPWWALPREHARQASRG
ncbi:fatty acid desaturase [Chthonobacter rhizosphaerae]|uniref:fatty acid desaturase n=1 Tax=Chthonobacter rhizosphaerae TaxID=2735553 RepID=UPI0015EF1406|nr:fatty acid desaturase [Chthonobacter rhizosphaerae]